MRVKPVDPSAVIRDPHTQRVLSAEGDDVPDNTFWNRRIIAGEVVRIDEGEKPRTKAPTSPIGSEIRHPAKLESPTGHEPVAPLTTRKDR